MGITFVVLLAFGVGMVVGIVCTVLWSLGASISLKVPKPGS